MNCKQGDLAIIVRSEVAPEFIGRIVRLGGPVTMLEIPGWFIDGEPLDGRYWLVADRCVRPIRDQPGDDETLALAGRPVPAAHAPT